MAVHNSGQETELEEPQLVLKKELGTLLGTVIKNVRTFWKGVVFASNWHTLTLIVLTCSATLMCSKGVLDFSCSTNMSIVAVGTIFPLVFSVQAAFARREVVLESLAKIKAASFTIYLMFLTWEKEGTGKWASEAEQLIHKLLDDMEWYFRCEKRTEETGNVVYDGFATFAAKMDEFGPKAGFTQGGQGGMSRMTVYLRTIMQEFERIRAIRDTETPVGLRLFCFSLIHFAPIVLAPYWNHFCIEQSGLVEIPSMYGCEAGALSSRAAFLS